MLPVKYFWSYAIIAVKREAKQLRDLSSPSSAIWIRLKGHLLRLISHHMMSKGMSSPSFLTSTTRLLTNKTSCDLILELQIRLDEDQETNRKGILFDFIEILFMSNIARLGFRQIPLRPIGRLQVLLGHQWKEHEWLIPAILGCCRINRSGDRSLIFRRIFCRTTFPSMFWKWSLSLLTWENLHLLVPCTLRINEFISSPFALEKSYHDLRQGMWYLRE